MRNIALIGFMGTGKSTVGKLLAKELKLRFIDLDSEIEREVGKGIPEIFEKHGEDYFRKCESSLLKKYLNADHLVIATGGGVVLDPINREQLKKNSTVIGLTASIEELMMRLGNTSDRPLLKGNVEANIRERLERRKGLYDFGDLTIDTTGKTIINLVSEIMEKLETFPDVHT